MWQSTAPIINNQLKDTSVNDALVSSVNAAIAPDDKSEKNANSDNAASDQRRELISLSELELVMASPELDGVGSGNKRDMRFFLSPESARDSLVKKIKPSWQSAVIIVVMADSVSQFYSALNNLNSVFPTVEVARSMRWAKSISEHEENKRYVALSTPDSIKQNVSTVAALSGYQTVLNNVAVSEAVASDTSTTGLFSDFISRRSQRLGDIKAAVSVIGFSGDIQYSLYLSGGDIAEQLAGLEPPSQQAPFCFMLALGGSEDAVNHIKEVVGL